MFSDANIFIKPEEIWDYFQKNRVELLKMMEPVAQNDEYDVVIYLSNDNGLPNLTIESSNIDTEEYVIEDEESCPAVTSMIYELYLTDKIITVMMGEEEGCTYDGFSTTDIEDLIAERDADINCFVLRLLEDLFADEPIIYSTLIDEVVEDCKEHFLEYLYRKHGLSVYRPMELEDEDGVFIEDYPYECMDFEPCSLYDEK